MYNLEPFGIRLNYMWLLCPSKSYTQHNPANWNCLWLKCSQLSIVIICWSIQVDLIHAWHFVICRLLSNKIIYTVIQNLKFCCSMGSLWSFVWLSSSWCRVHVKGINVFGFGLNCYLNMNAQAMSDVPHLRKLFATSLSI